MLRRFRRLPRSRRILVSVTVIALFVAGLSGGCFAHQRPSPPTAEERVQLRDAPLPYTIAVAWWDKETNTGQNPEAYAGGLAKVVAASRAFKTSSYERSSNPTGQDLVATSTGLYCNTAVLPFLTIISLGIIPTVFDDEHCEGMLLRKAAGQPKHDGVEVTMRFKGRVVMGWAALFMGALPGWSYRSVESDSRFTERFRLAVIARRADIERLVRSSSIVR
ncbi:MAG TPA: hypothetical protein VM166_06315 [Gemmatimonadaceae bacterium]|nr:hypothetical protein [Gemmatimonadaceae bacterium]